MALSGGYSAAYLSFKKDNPTAAASRNDWFRLLCAKTQSLIETQALAMRPHRQHSRNWTALRRQVGGARTQGPPGCAPPALVLRWLPPACPDANLLSVCVVLRPAPISLGPRSPPGPTTQPPFPRRLLIENTCERKLLGRLVFLKARPQRKCAAGPTVTRAQNLAPSPGTT